MFALLKLFKRKKGYWEITFGADVPGWVFFKTGVLKNFAKTTVKQLCWSLFLIEMQAHSKYFTGDCFSGLLELSMVKKSNENVYISLKAKSKHQVT